MVAFEIGLLVMGAALWLTHTGRDIATLIMRLSGGALFFTALIGGSFRR